MYVRLKDLVSSPDIVFNGVGEREREDTRLFSSSYQKQEIVCTRYSVRERERERENLIPSKSILHLVGGRG